MKGAGRRGSTWKAPKTGRLSLSPLSADEPDRFPQRPRPPPRTPALGGQDALAPPLSRPAARSQGLLPVGVDSRASDALAAGFGEDVCGGREKEGRERAGRGPGPEPELELEPEPRPQYRPVVLSSLSSPPAGPSPSGCQKPLPGSCWLLRRARGGRSPFRGRAGERGGRGAAVAGIVQRRGGRVWPWGGQREGPGRSAGPGS